MKILMSNIGYARGLSGSLSQHMFYAHRHMLCTPAVQQATLAELKRVILQEKPDLCCLAEVEKGSFLTGYFNQIDHLLDEDYRFHDIDNKYVSRGSLRSMPVAGSKCNGFFACREFDFEKLYLVAGFKRLVYKIILAPELTLFFAHFSLRRATRLRQFTELRKILDDTPGRHVLMGDFNILGGVGELKPLLEGSDLHLLNDPAVTTFRFHRQARLLDLCLCSQSLCEGAKLTVIDQPYSDHAALLLEINSEAFSNRKAN